MECGDLALRISQSQSGSLRLKMGEAFYFVLFFSCRFLASSSRFCFSRGVRLENSHFYKLPRWFCCMLNLRTTTPWFLRRSHSEILQGIPCLGIKKVKYFYSGVNLLCDWGHFLSIGALEGGELARNQAVRQFLARRKIKDKRGI